MLTPKQFKTGCYTTTLFIENEETQKYFDIINHSLHSNRQKTSPAAAEFVYYESHHIVPKSLGGSNSKCNLVLLTAEEHFQCHIHLTKMVEGADKSKMARALFRMVHGNKDQNTVSIDAEMYAELRARISTEMSFNHKGKRLSVETKQKMSASKMGNMSAEHKQAISDAQSGKIPWNKGLKDQISQETRDKIRQSKLGRKRGPLSDDVRQKMSAAHKGNIPWNAGKGGYNRKPHSEETKRKIKESWERRRAHKESALIEADCGSLGIVDHINVTSDPAHE